MKLLLKQKIFSWFDSYNIYDENNEIYFSAKGQLSWGHKFEIYDKKGKNVAMVRQAIFVILPKYEIYIKDELVGSVNQKLYLIQPKFKVDFNGWHVEEDFLEWNFTIYDNNRNVVATIKKEIFHLADTYVIDINNKKDDLYAMILVIVIDAIRCSRNNGISIQTS